MNKKILILLTSLVMTALFYGCGSGSATNNIQPWATEDEQARAAVNIVTETDFCAFAAFDVDETYQTVEMGVDYFKDGKLIADEPQGSTSLHSDGEAKAANGLAGFALNSGKLTMGVSITGDSETRIGEIEMNGYKDSDSEAMGFSPISEAQEIVDGKKIYLGIINSGSDEIDISILTDSDDNKNVKGKNWLPYVIFTK